jgi:hypothetical protein
MWNEISCTKLHLPPEPLTRGLPPPDPRSLCPLSSTEFVEPPPIWKKIPGYATVGTDELHQFSVCQDTNHGEMVGHILTNINGDDLEVWCISSAHMPHVYVYESQTKVLGTWVSVYLLLELLCCCNFVFRLRCWCIHGGFAQLICTWILSVPLNPCCLVLHPCLSCHLLC